MQKSPNRDAGNDMTEPVTLSIVNYRSKKLLDRCLAQLASLGLPEDWQTTVVDNDSRDGSPDMVARKYPWVELIASDTNLGFGGGHNLVYRRSRARLFFVLNPDVIVLPSALETMVEAFGEHPEAAVIGPCLLNPDETCQFSARRFYDWRTVILRRLPLPGSQRVHDHHLMKGCDLSQTQAVDWVLGAAMGIRRAAFDREELFDPRYRLYFEDVDLCYFAEKAGWQVLYCPEAVMIHDHQRASAGNRFNSAARRHFMSWVRFYLKTKTYRSNDGGHSNSQHSSLTGRPSRSDS